MLKRKPTRIELKQEDVDEYDEVLALRIQQLQQSVKGPPSLLAGDREKKSKQQRIGYGPAKK